MSNARKLQTEIDRVMKKVDEGVELFDEIWEKVYSAEQQNQKEKYEMDLKKEIKKLQRLRDQIKSWIGSSDVKDKEPLLDARRLIETKMEAFKYCEKETKTKTYSKEGLAKAEKLTPEEEAKKSTCEWINDIIEKLNQMVEDRDLEVERLAAGKGKKTNKNLIDDCNHFLQMHRFHLTKLEGIIRLVNNDVLSVEVVDPIKEDLDYYIDSYEDDDYQQAYDEDFFYEALGLDDLQVVNVDRVTQASAEKEKAKKNDPYSDLASSSSKGSEKGSKKSKKSSSTTMIPLTIGRARKGKKSKSTSSSKSSSSANTADASGDDDSTHGNTPTKRRGGLGGIPTPTTIPAASTVSNLGGSSMAAILKRETEQQEKERAQKAAQALAAEQLRLQQLQAQQQAALRAQQQQEQLRLQQQEAQMRMQQVEAAAKQKAMQEQQQAAQAAQIRQQQEAQIRQQQLQKAQQQQQHQQQQSAGGAADANSKGGTGSTSSVGTSGSLDIISGIGGMSLGVPTSGGGSGASSVGSRGSQHRRGASNHSSDGGSSSVNGAVLGSMGGAAPADGSVLQESYATLPSSNEHDRTTSRTNAYTPQNPYANTPASYPSTPNPIFENPSVFEKLGTDALFYIFYYKQGTYQQYLAARELKKQSWRFHKKYMTWFQRHEEPKVTTDEYEQGTYVYFDWETGWCTRIKQEFRFEYSFLEDTLQ
ncbi:unnamed protein product [Pseudo-nitzschia multistriata]|uniref:NOT2/NOT3/NOT5 C-terminal domain-containing protein n=1 Tax=Pseudo-nitzschia multistriata TaxID=183589 RepID=A0A448ZE46_9STRA|nr:unnamed protein product [Pseudo-nitzschia multistriata]